MSVTVSVVVPVYNVEKYIDQCLDSLVSQTLSGVEIILVDDGSPDRCPQIIDSWAKRYPNIRAIHQKNAGYGAAVTKGIELASGQYVGIIEPDDWIEPTMYEKLYNKAKKYNAELARCGFYVYDSTKSEKLQNQVWSETQNFLDNCPEGVFDPDDFREIFEVHSAIWTYIYRKDVLSKVKIDTQKKAYQDMPFIFEILARSKSVVVVKECLHHYRMENNQGSSSMTLSKRALDMIDMTYLTQERLSKCGRLNELSKEFYQHCIKANQYFYEKTPPEFRSYYREKMHDFFLPYADELCEGLSPQFSDWFKKVRWYKLNKLGVTQEYAFANRGGVNVAFCSDKNNIKYLSVALESLVAHVSASRKYNIYLLSDDLSLSDQALLTSIVKEKDNVEFKYIDIKENLSLTDSLFIDRHLTTAAYWRFLLPEILYGIDKILYLDTDVIICDDVGIVFDTDMEGYHFAGCLDQAVHCCNFGDFKLSKEILARFKYTDFSSYINSGVLLLNLEQLRIEKISRKLLDCASKNKLIFHDQDAINIVSKHHIKLLDQRWNFTTHLCPELYSIDTQKSMLDMISAWDIGIIHYLGAFKPWNSDNGCLYMIWRQYALKSPYFIEVSEVNKNQTHYSSDVYITIPMRFKSAIKKICPKILWNKFRDFKNLCYQDNGLTRLCKKILPMRVCRWLVKLRNYLLP